MKAQSKRILTAALALGMCIGMTACGEDKTPKETTAATTTAVIATESTVEATTTAPETEPEEEKLGINQDLVSEYGQTFAEISAKHGRIIGCARLHGGPFFKFETGYGLYYFYGTDIINPNAWGTIEETGEKFPLPDDDFKCINIEGIKASDFFDCEFETLTPQEVENIEGMQLHETGESELVTELKYYSTFSYAAFSHENTGFTGDKVIITMHQKDDGIITPDTKVDIDLWRTDADVYLGTTQN